MAFVSTDPKRKPRELIYEGRPIELNEHTFTWPFIYDRMQSLESDVRMVLNYRRNGREGSAEVAPLATDEPYADRGLQFTASARPGWPTPGGKPSSWAFSGPARIWARVVGFLQKLFTGSISPKNLGGPISIAAVAGSEASQGIARLLIFLTFLSANLAILNFLPIPALDGGHMVFLLAEGIRGKPVDERMQVALTLAGVACLLGLMIFVFALDIGRFFL